MPITKIRDEHPSRNPEWHRNVCQSVQISQCGYSHIQQQKSAFLDRDSGNKTPIHNVLRLEYYCSGGYSTSQLFHAAAAVRCYQQL